MRNEDRFGNFSFSRRYIGAVHGSEHPKLSRVCLLFHRPILSAETGAHAEQTN